MVNSRFLQLGKHRARELAGHPRGVVELEADPSLPAAELARRTYGSFATAWHVKHDWQVLVEAGAI